MVVMVLLVFVMATGCLIDRVVLEGKVGSPLSYHVVLCPWLCGLLKAPALACDMRQ